MWPCAVTIRVELYVWIRFYTYSFTSRGQHHVGIRVPLIVERAFASTSLQTLPHIRDTRPRVSRACTGARERARACGRLLVSARGEAAHAVGDDRHLRRVEAEARQRTL